MADRTEAMRPMMQGVEQVRPDEITTLLGAGVVVIDVRERFEWDDDHIPGTLLRPMSRFLGWADEFPPEQELVIMCRSGNRSQQIARVLATRGHTRVHNLEGGILEWDSMGRPL